MAETIALIITACFGSSGMTALILAVLQRRWAKQDRKEDKEDSREDKNDEKLTAVVAALKVLMVERVRWLGGKYINANSITLTDKETLEDMYTSYKELGGNGHLETIMGEIENLPVKLH